MCGLQQILRQLAKTEMEQVVREKSICHRLFVTTPLAHLCNLINHLGWVLFVVENNEAIYPGDI